jgi:hypothetical protein
MSKRSDCRRLSAGLPHGRRPQKRRLGVETLERRELLAAGVGYGLGPAYVAPPPSNGAIVQQGDQIRDRLHIHDGTCQTTATLSAVPTSTLQRDQTKQRDQDRLRDGSCQTTATLSAAPTSTLLQDRDQIKLRKQEPIRAQDGSCQTAATPAATALAGTQDQIMRRDPIRDLARDGSCK